MSPKFQRCLNSAENIEQHDNWRSYPCSKALVGRSEGFFLPRQEVWSLLDPGRHREPEAVTERPERTRRILVAGAVKLGRLVRAEPVGEMELISQQWNLKYKNKFLS